MWKPCLKLKINLCKIYKDVCTCGESYIGETIRNVEVRWDEHYNPVNKSNPSKHIKDNLDRVFNRSVLANAPKEHVSTKGSRGISHCSGKAYT